jgi:hypothetical protein
MKPKLRPLGLGASACLLLGACQMQAQPTPGAAVPSVTELQPLTIYASASCGQPRPSVRMLTDQASLTQVIEGGRLLGAEPKSTPLVDFASNTVVMLSMGQQPTAGYLVSVTAASVHLASRALTVNTLWKLPEPGSMQAMVITHPCAVFGLPRGDYRSLRVVDQHQQERLRVDLNAAAR